MAINETRLPTVDLVVCIYNEEECLPSFFAEVLVFARRCINDAAVRFIFADDGSGDSSREMIERFMF